MSLFEIRKRAARDEIAAPVRHFQRQTVMTIEQEPIVGRDARESLQIGNDHDWKLETLRLVNRHQSHRIRSLVDLSFAFATADRFEVLDITHKIANQMRARALKPGRQRKQSLDVREALRAIKVCRNSGHVLRFRDGVTK